MNGVWSLSHRVNALLLYGAVQSCQDFHTAINNYYTCITVIQTLFKNRIGVESQNALLMYGAVQKPSPGISHTYRTSNFLP